MDNEEKLREKEEKNFSVLTMVAYKRNMSSDTMSYISARGELALEQ